MVFLKDTKDPLAERYSSEADAQAAVAGLTKAVKEGTTCVVSIGGGISFASSEYKGAQIRPVRG
jgi:hypothetical protein